jgi:hypothetical protein
MLHYFLGFEIIHSAQDLFVTQTRYFKIILARANMLGAKSYTTLIQLGLQLPKTFEIPLSYPHLYHTIVGAPQYTIITQPDFTFL